MITKASKPYRLLGVDDVASGATLYHIPRLEIRKKLKPGYFVKLAFSADQPENGASVERLWVEVTGGTPALYTGKLRSSPAFLKDLLPGEPVMFGPEHVADVSLPAT